MSKHRYLKTIKYALVGACIIGIMVAVYFSRNVMFQKLDGNLAQKTAFEFPSGFEVEDYVILELVPDYSYASLGYGFEDNEPINIFEACTENKKAAEWLQKVAGSENITVSKSITKKKYKQIVAEKKSNGNYFEVASDSMVASGSGIAAGNYVLKNGNPIAIKKNPLSKLKCFNGEDVRVVTLTASDLNNVDLTLDEAIKKWDEFLNKIDMIYVNASYGSKEEQLELSKLKSFNYYGNTQNAEKTFASDSSLDLDFSIVCQFMKMVGAKEDPIPVVFDKTVYDDALNNSDTSKSKIETRQYALNRALKYQSKKEKKDLQVLGEGGLLDAETDKFKAGVGKGSNNNIYKFYLMSMFRDPAEFYNLFFESGSDADASNKPIKLDGTAGKNCLQTGDAQLYWNTYSFLPCKGELSASSNIDKREAGDTDYWKDMKITLEPEDNSWWNNCNTLSIVGSFFSKDYSDNCTNINNIVNYKPVTAYTDSRIYTVLELEATNNYTYASEKLNGGGTYEGRAYFEKMFPYTGYTTSKTFWVVVKGMSTATFVSKRNDLTSEYDMIYIGDNIKGFRTENGKTKYGSKSKSDRNYQMNGVIYSHQGPFVKFRTKSDGKDTWIGQLQGSSNYAYFGDGKREQISYTTGAVKLLSKDFTSGSLRYSGTDITTVRAKHLSEYLKAGLPVVVAKTLYNDVMSTTPHSFGNEKNSTYFEDVDENEMYQFIRSNSSKMFHSGYDYHNPTYGLGDKDKSSEAFANMCVGRQVLTVKKLTTSKNESFDENALKKNCTFKKFSTSDQVRQFTFKIEVTGADETQAYQCLIYVDKNADGVYKKSECVRRTEIKLKESNANVSFNMNHLYTGAFTWKVIVFPSGNPNMVASQIGYGNIKNTGEPPSITVLQLKSSEFHGTDWASENCDTVNIGELISDARYSGKVEYKITLKTKYLEAFNREIKDNVDAAVASAKSDKKAAKIAAKKQEIENLKTKYDMIVFGFADSYSAYELGETTSDVIYGYIASGKSVLFSHDLTGPQNHTNWDKNESTAWDTYHTEPNTGKGFNFYLRDIMGLNRFKMNTCTKDDDGNYIYSSSAYTKHDKHYANDWLPFGFTYTILMHNSCSYFAGWNNVTVNGRFTDHNTNKQYEGWDGSTKGKDKANEYAKTYEYWGPFNGLVTNMWVGEKSDNNHHSPDISNGYVANTVAKVNDGQITKYPFDLDDTLSDDLKASKTALGIDKYNVTDTHTQAYQLNVEDEDTICWFTMQNAENSTKWYDTSPMDGANNYYIYNKGNVTYTGIGHRGTLTDFEKKLFINVFVAALRAGVDGPQPEITNGYTVTEKTKTKNAEGKEEEVETDVQYIFADVDADSEQSEFNEHEDVDFYVTDDSTSSDWVYVTVEKKNSSSKLFEPITVNDDITIVGKDGNTVQPACIKTASDGTKYYVWKILKTNYTDTGVEGNSLVNADNKTIKGYTLKYPRKELKTSSAAAFRISAFGCDNDKLGIKGVLEASLRRRSLFKLD